MLAEGQPGVIEAVVTRDGRVVRDLRADDLRLWIDGKPRAVTAAIPQSAGEMRTALVFDNSTLSAADQSRIRRLVAGFLQSDARPPQQFAVARWFAGMEVVQPFTPDSALLRSALENLGASAVVGTGARGEITSGYDAEAGRRGADAGANAGSLVRTQYLMDSLAGLCGKLAPMRGRKGIWFITGGGYAMPAEDTDRLINKPLDVCNRANVTVHGISNDSSFSYALSSRTGGTSVRLTSTLDKALERLSMDEAGGYRIEFAADPPIPAGCHDVRIRVPKGMDVRSRKRYCAP
jgi:VWFA-related protein